MTGAVSAGLGLATLLRQQYRKAGVGKLSKKVAEKYGSVMERYNLFGTLVLGVCVLGDDCRARECTR